MSRVFLTMAMSLDGFITGPQDDAKNPAGIDGMRLMDWLGGGGTGDEGDRVKEDYRPADPNSRIVYDEMLSTGAVITGKRTGDFAGYWGGDHHDGVPIFVPTHEPPSENPHQRVHYITDGIEACVEQAKAAAGDRDVMMHGAYTAQEALKAGVLDAVEIQLRPVLLGQGRRLFDGLPAGHIELDLVRTLEAPGVLHLRYDVRHLMRPRRPAIRLDMSISLDGYVVGLQDSTDEPMGVGGFRLFNWLDNRLDPGPNGQVFAELNATRAVIAGRRTYEHADRWHGDHHDGVPVFVLTHHVPAAPPPGSVHYVTDVHACAAQARAAAGDADVVVLGAGAAQALLRAGELDELELHVVPVLLGQGRRLFDHLPAELTELELTRELPAADADPAHRVLHLRYRIQGPPATQTTGAN